ncbi:MAG: hypothetical protein J0L84_00830 [Verrucomicrobia bacterium]|nr:hypothetical protein [Verrucomicrobiota bacterium]
MNDSLLRRFLARSRKLELTLGSILVVASSLASLAQEAGATADPFVAPPGSATPETLDAGKVAEEGDHDLDQAGREYQAVVASYEALRPRAAEALFRLGEIAARRQQTNEARELYVRVLAEFPLERDYAVQSRERLAAFDPQRELRVYAMDPALAQRYGLNPQNTPPGMDPTLARRYGLMVGGSPPAVGAGGGIGGGDGAGLVASSQPQSLGGSSFGGVGGMASRSIGASAVSASPYSVNITGGSTDKAATLRAEAAQIAAQLRKLRRERRALEGAPLHQMPSSLVEDPQILMLIQAADRAQLDWVRFVTSRSDREPDAGAGQPGEVEEARRRLQDEENALDRSVKKSERVLAQYLSETYLPRMRRTEELLTTELDELEVEIDKARPKF